MSKTSPSQPRKGLVTEETGKFWATLRCRAIQKEGDKMAAGANKMAAGVNKMAAGANKMVANANKMANGTHKMAPGGVKRPPLPPTPKRTECLYQKYLNLAA